MSLPAGITTCTVTFGRGLDLLGTEATVTGTVTMDRALVWAETGDAIYPTVVPVPPTTPGPTLSFVVPHVDQDGFTDTNGNPVTRWAYTLTAQVSFPDGQRQVIRKPFQVLVGQDNIDLDLVPGGSVVTAVTAPYAGVTSLAGETGAVTAPQLRTALELPDSVADADTLPATIATEVSTISAPAFIASENLRAKSQIVVGPYYGAYTNSGTSLIQAQGAIEGAQDAANQQGGGKIIIPPMPGRVHRADQIAVAAGQHLCGVSRYSYGTQGAGILAQNGGVNEDFIIVDPGSNPDTRPFVGPFGITDLVLLGVSSSTQGNGIAIRCPDDRLGILQDIIDIRRLVTSYFFGNGIYAPGGSPVIIEDITGLWNGGHVVQLVDTGVDAANKDMHHVVLRNISGDGNLGFQSDAYGAVVHIKGHRKGFSATIDGIKSEYRKVPAGFHGSDGTKMGNAHALIIEDCDSDIRAVGITHISTGDQTRRPDAPVLIIGSRTPNFSWDGVGVRGAHPGQTGPVMDTIVRDVTQPTGAPVTINYTEGSNRLGPVVDAKAVPEFAAGQSCVPLASVNGEASIGSGQWRLKYFTAARTESVSQAFTRNGGGATAGTTLAGVALAEVQTNGDLKVVAVTANDTALWGTTNTDWTKAFTASVVLKKGQRYAAGPIWAGTTGPSFIGQAGVPATELAKAPRKSGQVTGLSALPTLGSTISAASVTNSGLQFYVGLS